MLRLLKELISTLNHAPTAAAPLDEHALQLATAVLLVEVMRADPGMATAERQAVLAALRRKFELTESELQGLLELAEHTARQASDFHTFTSTLNNRLDHTQKVRVVEAMWQVAYADGQLTAHEKHVLWRVADLLHLPHGAYINAKMRAKAAAESGSGPA